MLFFQFIADGALCFVRTPISVEIFAEMATKMGIPAHLQTAFLSRKAGVLM